MTPLLFAMVDAVLCARLERHALRLEVAAFHEKKALRRWWRSTWGVE